MEFRIINYIPIKSRSMKEHEVVHHLKPENITLIQEKKVGDVNIRSYDFGRFCFIRRENKLSFNSESGRKEFKVDLSSMDEDRIPFVRTTIDFLRENRSSESSIIDIAQKLVTFYHFLDSDFSGDNWPISEDKALLCYQEYAEYTISKSRLPKNSKKSISPFTAAKYTNFVRDLIIYSYGISKRDIESIVPSIPMRSSSIRKDVSSNSEVKKYIRVCLSIFLCLQDCILNRKPFPWVLDISKSGIDKKIYWDGRSSLTSIFNPYFYDGSNGMISMEEFVSMVDSYDSKREYEKISINGVTLSTKNQAKSWFRVKNKYWVEVNGNNELYDDLVNRSYDLSVYCFWYCFIAATGLNYSVASTIEYGSEEYIPEVGFVFPGLKVRAGNKVVHAEFRKSFEKYFFKFKELRSWAVERIGFNPDVWFFLFDIDEGDGERRLKKKVGERIVKRNSYRKIPDSKCYALESIFNKNEIEVKRISLTELRKAVSIDWFRISGGDTLLVSQKLGNRISTVERYYSDSNSDDSFIELADYYSNVFDRIKSTGLSDGEEVPVEVIFDNTSRDMSVPVGNCKNIDLSNPKKSKKFSNIDVKPDCVRSETCLFCEFYAIHADREGLTKILSFKELFPLIKQRTESIDQYLSVFAPVEGRVNEILEYIQKEFPETIPIVEDVSRTISEGDIDDFWEGHFNFLTDIGYVE